MVKNILVVGANFENKGAQSMLFITIDELKKRIPDCIIYFAGTEIFDEKIYAFHELFYWEPAKYIALKNNAYITLVRCLIKDVVKLCIGRKDNLFRFMEPKNKLPSFDLMIDVSGYNLGEKWSVEVQEAYLNNIRLAKKNNIPVFVMPQSFGSFDYSEEKKHILNEIQELMQYPEIIFVRESEGYNMMKELFGLTNIKLSTDLVLQNMGVDIRNIFKKVPSVEFPTVAPHAVGVIPNTQCFKHGNKEKILSLYKDVINYLLKEGKKVYIFRHSKEDLQVCRMIAEMFDDNVVLLDNDFSCLDYDQFVKNFDFIICSRYHGIVHAYRNYIPCILLGWAIKYKELAKNVGQEKYSFDITSNECNADNVNSSVVMLAHNLGYEAETIRKHVDEIQKDNCFNYIEQWVKSNG